MGDNYINKIHGSLIQDIVLTKKVEGIDADISNVKTAVEEVQKAVEKVDTAPFKNISVAFTSEAWSKMYAMTTGETAFISGAFVLAGITYNGVDYIFSSEEGKEQEKAANEDAFARALLADGLITEDLPEMAFPAEDLYVKIDHVLGTACLSGDNGVKPVQSGFDLCGRLTKLSFYLSDGKYVMEAPDVVMLSGVFTDARWLDEACYGIYAINSCVDVGRILNVYCIKADTAQTLPPTLEMSNQYTPNIYKGLIEVYPFNFIPVTEGDETVEVPVGSAPYAKSFNTLADAFGDKIRVNINLSTTEKLTDIPLAQITEKLKEYNYTDLVTDFEWKGLTFHFDETSANPVTLKKSGRIDQMLYKSPDSSFDPQEDTAWWQGAFCCDFIPTPSEEYPEALIKVCHVYMEIPQ